jgi:adenine phosphoribosyltransferase
MVIPADALKQPIRTIPDFPKKGIQFRDITTLLKDPKAFKAANDFFFERYKGQRIDKIVGIEARGFIFGASIADRLGVGFVPVRKKGKLPAPTVGAEYSLEYGRDIVEIHRDSISKGERILLHDDLLATGGTMKAASSLVETLGATIIEIAFLVELTFLPGRSLLKDYSVYSLVQYEKE